VSERAGDGDRGTLNIDHDRSTERGSALHAHMRSGSDTPVRKLAVGSGATGKFQYFGSTAGAELIERTTRFDGTNHVYDFRLAENGFRKRDAGHGATKASGEWMIGGSEAQAANKSWGT
jgi:hypothetical protein